MESTVPDDHKQAAIEATAKLITDDSSLAAAAEPNSIPADEVIITPKPAEYLPPAYLQKTAPQLAPAFAELLARLGELNARFVGERTVEAQAMLSLTGEHEWLEEKFHAWCQMYFKIRGNHVRLNSQNGNDPWRLYQDCYEEFERLLERRLLQPGTINSSVLNLSQRYMLSAFAAEVLGPDLRCFDTTGRDRFGSAASRKKANTLVSSYWHEVGEFTKFLQGLTPYLPPKYAANQAEEWLTSIQDKVTLAAEDLTFLRHVLCALTVNDTEKQQLADDLWARIMWDVYHGRAIAMVLTSSSPEPSTEAYSNHLLAIRRDGWLCHREFPWVRVQPDFLPDERREELAVNWYVLDALTEPFYEAWDRLDTGPVLSRGSEADATEEEQDAAIAVALAEPDTAEIPTPIVPTKKVRVPRLRLSKFEKITTDHFQCEWSQAKGSERKVFRKGGKQFTFGCHGIDRQVSPAQIKNCLKKLEIRLVDFVAACH